MTVYIMLQEAKAGTADETNLVALSPKKKIPFALTEKIELSHNTRLFRFALQSSRHRLGLPIGQHMFFYCKVPACLTLYSSLWNVWRSTDGPFYRKMMIADQY